MRNLDASGANMRQITDEDFLAELLPDIKPETKEQIKTLLVAEELSQRMYNSYTFTNDNLDSRQPRYAIATAALALEMFVRRAAAGIAAAFGARCTVTLGERLYPPTINDGRMAALVARAAGEVVTPDRLRLDPGVRTMAAEDFSEYAIRVPGCYFFLGIRDEAAGIVHPHHSPRFDVSESACGSP